MPTPRPTTTSWSSWRESPLTFNTSLTALSDCSQAAVVPWRSRATLDENEALPRSQPDGGSRSAQHGRRRLAGHTRSRHPEVGDDVPDSQHELELGRVRRHDGAAGG